ncbi:MAG: PilZ domain-containing protein [Magnetococcales bacterium]|nr:PilZ domain-containing protein [Magnetococcales bacterium]
MPGGSEKRQEQRLVRSDPAVMILADGSRVNGLIGNMSLGGLLFLADGTVPIVAQNAFVDIVISLYGRDSQFTCTMTHQQDNQFGLKLHRSE